MGQVEVVRCQRLPAVTAFISRRFVFALAFDLWSRLCKVVAAKMRYPAGKVCARNAARTLHVDSQRAKLASLKVGALVVGSCEPQSRFKGQKCLFVCGKVASQDLLKSNLIAAIRADEILIDKLKEMLIVLDRQHGCVRHTADADFVGAAILLDFLEELLGWLGHVCQKVLEAKQDQRRGICGKQLMLRA